MLTRSTASSGQSRELLIIHDFTQTEISQQQIRFRIFRSVQQVFRFDICRISHSISIFFTCHVARTNVWLTSVNDSMWMQVFDGTHDGFDEFRGVLLFEVLEGADSVEKFSSLTKVSHEVHYERKVTLERRIHVSWEGKRKLTIVLCLWEEQTRGNR